MQITNETLLSEAMEESPDRIHWTAAVVENPAAAHGSFRRAEHDRVLPRGGHGDASQTVAVY